MFWVKINVIIFCENSGRDKNDTGQENIPKLFYGPPGNCADLSKLGYTLNGYYLVNGSKNSNIIEVVLCKFQLPSPGDNNSNFPYKVSNKWNKKVNNCIVFIASSEERLGFINIDRIKAIMNKVQCKKNILFRKFKPFEKHRKTLVFFIYFNST